MNRTYRPRLSNHELTFLIQVLEKVIVECDVSSIDERRRKFAAEMLVHRFKGVLEGGRPRRDVIGDFSVFASVHKQ